MRKVRIHSSQLLTLNKLNIKMPIFDEIREYLMLERCQAICFNAMKYKSEVLEIEYNPNKSII
jgi:hypothetical protein